MYNTVVAFNSDFLDERVDESNHELFPNVRVILLAFLMEQPSHRLEQRVKRRFPPIGIS